MDIGDIIYVLIFVGVLVFRAYEGYKKKEKEKQKKASQYQDEYDTDETSIDTVPKSIEDTFNEILGIPKSEPQYYSEDNYTDEATEEEIVRQNDLKKEIPNREIFTYDNIKPDIMSYEINKVNNSNNIAYDIKTQAMLQEEEDASALCISDITEDFDLKKAFIYSQIIERKY